MGNTSKAKKEKGVSQCKAQPLAFLWFAVPTSSTFQDHACHAEVLLTQVECQKHHVLPRDKTIILYFIQLIDNVHTQILNSHFSKPNIIYACRSYPSEIINTNIHDVEGILPLASSGSQFGEA